MGIISITTSSDGQPETIAPTSNSLITIANEINGNLDNANVKTGANIDGNKLALNSVPGTKLEKTMTTYSPVWSTTGTLPIIGNGTLTGKYQRVGAHVKGEISLAYGTTTTGGTGFWKFSLPLPAAAPGRPAGQVIVGFAGNGLGTGGVAYITDVNNLYVYTVGNPIQFEYSATVPLTWAHRGASGGDFLIITFDYEAA